MPEEWSASGARLPLSLDVCFTGDPVSGGDLRWSVEEPSCCPAKRLLVTSAATLIGADGEVSVAVGAGGWLAEPEDRCGRSTLRFYLDFPDGELVSRLAVGESVGASVGELFDHAPPCCRSGAQRREPPCWARLLQRRVLGWRRARPLRGPGRGGARGD